MTGIRRISGTALPYEQDNVDTDQILPKQFLTRISKSGYGQFLFNDMRYINGDPAKDNPGFVLNNPNYQGASILLSGENFGCGSSREHAPWAISDYGFRVVVAESFADIFYNNCINNQILPVALAKQEIAMLFELVSDNPQIEFYIDLEKQIVLAGNNEFVFDIASNHKTNLLNGQDKIDTVLDIADSINAYQKTIPQWRL